MSEKMYTEKEYLEGIRGQQEKEQYGSIFL